MKHQWLIIILILTMASCKSYVGTYCTERRNACFVFKKDDTFRYDEANCTFLTGAGKFKVADDTISFMFANSKAEKGSYEIEKVATMEQEVVIHVSIIDSASQKPLAFYNAALVSDKAIAGGDTGDFDGKAEIAVAHNGEPHILKLQFVTHYPICLEINEQGEYKIDAEMVGGYVKPVNKQDWVFKLLAFNNDSISWTGFEDGDWVSTYYRYKKKKGRK